MDKNVKNTIDVKFPATQTVTGNITVDNLPPTQTIDGSITVDNFPQTQNVTGNITVDNLPSTQTVEGVINIETTQRSLVDGKSNFLHVPIDNNDNELAFPSYLHCYNGASWDRIVGNNNDGLLVEISNKDNLQTNEGKAIATDENLITLNDKIPRSIRYYRSRGECFVFSTEGYADGTVGGLDANVWALYNNDSSNKCYLYQLTLMVNHPSDSSNTSGGITVTLSSTQTIPTGGDAGSSHNLKLNGASSSMTERVGSPSPTEPDWVSAGTLTDMESWRIKNDANNRNNITVIDFQEAMIEIPYEYGLVINISANDSDTDVNYSVTGRYIDTVLNSEFP